MKRLSPVTLVSLLLACAALLAAPDASLAQAVAQKPIVVGATVAASGEYERAGKYQEEGYRWWAAKVNERGGLLGRKVELRILDDKSSSQDAKKLYERLITQEKVDLILGPYSSGVTAVASTVSEKYKMPMVAGGAASTEIWKRGFKYVFMVYTPAENYFDGVIDIAKQKGFKSVAFMYEDAFFPKSVVLGATQQAKKAGLAVVHSEAYPKGLTDFVALLSKIKARNPDLLLAGTYAPDSQQITRQMKELDVRPKLFAATVGPATPEFYKNLGPIAENVIGPSQWEPTLKTKGNADFVRTYTEMFKREPDYHTGSAVAAAIVLEEAVRRAGSLDQEKIRQQLVSMKLETPFGKYGVNADGLQMEHESILIQWQNGKKEIIWPAPLASAQVRIPLR
ncbi:MAG: amino acid ABC transporter substrate-binding protein [Candidatus Tectomicrobia bacterium]|nr:amino acid ABC transporter substrate-binding protein [Candidatus Tectomicrobia bacterium]